MRDRKLGKFYFAYLSSGFKAFWAEGKNVKIRKGFQEYFDS